MTQRRLQSHWSNPPAQDKRPKRLPKSLPKQWRFQPSFETRKEMISWLYRREQAIKRALRPRKLADGPGPGGSWTVGFKSNPGLVGWALIRDRQRRDRQRARDFDAAAEEFQQVYALLRQAEKALDDIVQARANVLARERRRLEKKVKVVKS